MYDCVVVGWSQVQDRVVYWDAINGWVATVDSATVYEEGDEPDTPDDDEGMVVEIIFRKMPPEVFDHNEPSCAISREQAAIFSYLKTQVSDSVLLKTLTTIRLRGLPISPE